MCVLSFKYKESTHFDTRLVKRVQRITVLKVYECHPLTEPRPYTHARKGNVPNPKKGSVFIGALHQITTFFFSKSAGAITFGDIKEWIPWGDTYDIGYLKGQFIVEALEKAATSYGLGGEVWWTWRFFHVSGKKKITA